MQHLVDIDHLTVKQIEKDSRMMPRGFKAQNAFQNS